MRLMKKIIATTMMLSLVTVLVPGRAKAASDFLDFEDGKVPAGIQMAMNEDGSHDGDPSILSVVDFEGSKRLKIDSQESGTPKVKFMLADLVGEENVTKVVQIEYSIIIEQTDGRTPEWNGGVIGATPTGPSGWANGQEWTIEEFESAITAEQKLSHTLKKDFMFTDPEKSFFMFMSWANNGTDIYLDDVKFYDEGGQLVPIAAKASAPADQGTSVPKTGHADYSSLFALAASVMAGGVLVSKKKNKEVK